MKIIAAIGVVLLLLLAPPAISQVPDDKLIVPGQRIGKWTLEMTVAALLQMNGPRRPPVVTDYDLPDAVSGLYEHRWNHLGVSAVTKGREGPRVEVLIVGLEEFKTNRGLYTTALG